MFIVYKMVKCLTVFGLILGAFSALGALPAVSAEEGPTFMIKPAEVGTGVVIHVAGPTVLIEQEGVLIIRPAEGGEESVADIKPVTPIGGKESIAEGPGTLPFLIERADWPVHVAGPTFMIKPAEVGTGVVIKLAHGTRIIEREGVYIITPAKGGEESVVDTRPLTAIGKESVAKGPGQVPVYIELAHGTRIIERAKVGTGL